MDLQRQLTIARQYVDQNRHPAAERLCKRILSQSPMDVFCVTYLARRAQAAGDLSQARQWLTQLTDHFPADEDSWRRLAMFEQQAGDLEAAKRAWERAISANCHLAQPFAHLADLHAQLGNAEIAARCYTRAFAMDPDLARARRDASAPISLRQVSQRGDNHLREFHHHRWATLAEEIESETGTRLTSRAHDFMAQNRQGGMPAYANPLQRPDFRYYPDLEARPFWDHSLFPWCATLESQTSAIRAEYQGAIGGDESLTAYVHATERAPEDWKDLSGSKRWGSLHLMKGGDDRIDNQKLCPITTAVLKSLPLAYTHGHSPEVFFSVLKSGTRIPPHYGVANTKLAVHLPLIIPDRCAIRVGDITRSWATGECLIFDDSFEHEAWNNSDQTRVVLILEVWHPDLREAERLLLARGTEQNARFYADVAEGAVDWVTGQSPP